MPGMTLCGEALTFAHDQDLLGFCLNNPDEPAGDDFDTRIHNKLKGGAWIDPHVGYCTQEDLTQEDDADDDEGSDEFEYVHRGMYAQFCAMSNKQQRVFIEKTRLMICMLIGVSHLDWEPTDAFVLDYIQDETPEDTLRDMAYAHYLATPTPDEDNPSDVSVGLDEEDDTIRIAHQGGHYRNNGLRREMESTHIERVEHDIGENKADRTCSRISNARRRTCFYRARRETMRRNWDIYNYDPFEIKMQQQDEALRAYIEEFERETPEVEFLSVRDQLMMHIPTPSLEDLTYEEIEENFSRSDLEREAMRRIARWFGYSISSDNDEEFTQQDIRDGKSLWPSRPRPQYELFDDFDDFGDDGDWYVGSDEEPMHPSSCNCSVCLAERYANRDDHCGDPMCSHCNSANDIFAGYGESEREIDEQIFAQSSGKRGMSRRSATSAKAERRA